MKIRVSDESLAEIKNWFTDYVVSFKKGDPDIQENIKLKEDHTIRVCKEIVNIGKRMGLNDDELRLAEIIALLHDIGRFAQYSSYKTFRDSESENHAELGIRILKGSGILRVIGDTEQNLALRSIRYHNYALLPEEESESVLFYPKLLRDADKLDIWKVVTDYYHNNDGMKNSALELDLPDTPGFSEEVANDIRNGKAVKMKNIRNLNDFKLLQAGWILDINFKPSFEIAMERQYLDKIKEALPESKIIDDIFISLMKTEVP